MRKKAKRIFSMALSVVMLLGIIPVQAFAATTVDAGGMITPQQVSDSAAETLPEPGPAAEPEAEPTPGPSAEKPQEEVTPPGTELPETESEPEEEPASSPSIGASGEEKEPEGAGGDAPVHWLQQYQQAALEAYQKSTMQRARTAKASGAGASYSMIQWSGGQLEFANGAYMKGPMPKIYLNGKIAFCAEWNGQNPSGDYVQSGEGSDPVIKQILANYDKSGKSNADYAAAQAAIWAHIMGTTVKSWGGCPGSASADKIMNGNHDTSNLKYNYISWTGGTQDLITYNTEEEPDPKPDPDPEEYPEDKYRIEVETDTKTETEVRNRKSYSYSDAIGQITIRKHDQDEKSLDGALFDIDVAFSDGTHTTVENWEVDNGARLFTWTHPKDNHDPATVTVTEVRPPHGYEMDPTPQTAVVAPTYTRVTHVETWTVTIVTETTSSTVIEIASGEVVAESESSSSAETESDPQVEEFTDFIEGDRETTMTFVNTAMPCSLTIYKYETGNKSVALEGASFRIRYADPHVSAQVWTQTTDKNGEIRISLPAEGALIIEELSAPEGYVMSAKTTYDVTIIKGEHKVVDIPNDKKTQLIAVKKDAQTGELLAGATIQATLLRSNTEPFEAGQVYTLTTGEDGRAVFSNMIPGEYRVEEVSPPPFYQGTTLVHTVNILEGNSEPVTVQFENEPWTGLTIRKVDATNGKGLAKAIFKVYRGSAEDPKAYLGDWESGANGNVVIRDLKPGYYTIVESQAPYGYLLDEEHRVQTIEIKPDAVDKNLTVVFQNQPRPKLLIQKIDGDTGTPLAGAAFRVAQRGSQEYTDAVTGPDGTALLENLEVGWYQVTELRSPTDYTPVGTHYDIELTAGKTSELIVQNRKKPTLTIEKIDSMTLQPLDGVVFEVRIKNGKSLGQFTTDAGGRIVVESLEPGQIYEVREVRALPGYLMDETVHEIKLDENENPVLKLKNIPEHPILIQKRDAVTGDPIPDTTFLVTHSDGRLVGEFTMGENGMATVAGKDVVPGWYLIKEVRANPAYIAGDETKLIELKYEAPAVVEFPNKPRTGLQIRKVDSVTGDPIPDVGFYIEEIDGRTIGTFYTDEAGVINLPDQEEIWVRVTETKPAGGYKPDPTPKTMKLESGKLNVMEWRNQPWPTLKIIKLDAETRQPMEGVKIRVYDKFHREAGTFTTNKLGEILLSGIGGGETLYLQEIETLKGYQLDESVHEVTLEWGKTSTVELLNKPLSTLRLLKIDSETEKPIYGAVFNLYDAKNNLLGKFTTDQNGVIEFPRELAEGKYKLKEVKCDGYVVDPTIRTVELKSGETTELTVENRPMRGQIQIVKKAAADNPITKDKAGALLEGAEFTIYNDKLEVVDVITTDAKGVATSKPLELATYAIKETASPEHYLTDGKVFYATLKVADDLVRFEVQNQPADVNVTVEKRGNMEVLAGDVMSYTFSQIKNHSNVALEEFYWRDMLPDEVRLGKIVTGTWSERLTYSVEYRTNRKNSWRTLEDGLSSKVSYTLDCGRENLKLAADEYVTEFRFHFGTVQPGFCEETGPTIFVTTLANLKNGYRIVNRTDAGGRTGEEWVIGKDSWITVVWNKDRGDLPKTGI